MLAIGCNKDMSVMLDNSATGNVGVSLIDTFTINTSTVQLTSIPSASRGSVLVGRVSDPSYGSISSSSYFRLGFSSFTNDIPETAVFDSINLVLKPNNSRYYFGDTTKTQTIRVHRLTQRLETKTANPLFPNQSLPVYVSGASIFSSQKFTYEETPLGELTFRPRVTTVDSLTIKLDNSLGNDLFNLIKLKDIKVSSNENFIDYFKGMALVPDDENTVAFGFSDTVQVKVNYNYFAADGSKRRGEKVLNITDRTYQYNQIDYDRTNTSFASLSATNREIKTSETDGETFIQSGSGVVTKITFPSLKDFLLEENLSVNKAELVIETSNSGTGMYAAPSAVQLFIADKEGIPVSYVSIPYRPQNIQQTALVTESQIGKNNRYTFDLIQYLKNLKSSSTYDEVSFYLSSAEPTLFSTFNTAFIAKENEKPKIKLNILYTKFK